MLSQTRRENRKIMKFYPTALKDQISLFLLKHKRKWRWNISSFDKLEGECMVLVIETTIQPIEMKQPRYYMEWWWCENCFGFTFSLIWPREIDISCWVPEFLAAFRGRRYCWAGVLVLKYLSSITEMHFITRC